MPDPREPADVPDPSSPERNPLGLGPRDRDSANTGSTDDTSYGAQGSDPYTTGEPRKDPGKRGAREEREDTADVPGEGIVGGQGSVAATGSEIIDAVEGRVPRPEPSDYSSDPDDVPPPNP